MLTPSVTMFLHHWPLATSKVVMMVQLAGFFITKSPLWTPKSKIGFFLKTNFQGNGLIAKYVLY